MINQLTYRNQPNGNNKICQKLITKVKLGKVLFIIVLRLLQPNKSIKGIT